MLVTFSQTKVERDLLNDTYLQGTILLRSKSWNNVDRIKDGVDKVLFDEMSCTAFFACKIGKKYIYCLSAGNQITEFMIQ